MIWLPVWKPDNFIKLKAPRTVDQGVLRECLRNDAA
jgi:hypothetical protein